MANEIKFGYLSGIATLTVTVFQPNGTERTANASLPEVATGYYSKSDANIQPGDIAVVYNGGAVVGAGEYKPDVVSGSVDSDLTSIESKIDSLIVGQNKSFNSYNEIEEETPIIQVF